MVVVAVAGGSDNVGRTMVETLLELREHEIIVLSRKQSPGVPNVESVVVDYGDVGAIAEALTQHDVHTVVARFAFREASNAELRKTTLEWTRVSNGFFPDYYGSPRVKTHLPTITFAVDIASREAALPGTRNESIAFTYSFDLARFVSASLSLPKWEETTYCYGDKTTWNEFIKVAEDITGSRLRVTYDPVEKLQKGEFTELPPHAKETAASPFPEALARSLLSILGLWTAEGYFNISVEGSLYQKFPNKKLMTVRDILLQGHGPK